MAFNIESILVVRQLYVLTNDRMLYRALKGEDRMLRQDCPMAASPLERQLYSESFKK